MWTYNLIISLETLQLAPRYLGQIIRDTEKVDRRKVRILGLVNLLVAHCLQQHQRIPKVLQEFHLKKNRYHPPLQRGQNAPSQL